MSSHVVIYTDDPDKGGVAQYNDQVARYLLAQGHRVTLVQTGSAAPLAARQARDGIAHFPISYDTGAQFGRTVTDASDAERAFAALQPDILVFSDCCPVSNLAAKSVAMRRRIPFIVTVNFAAEYLADRFGACLPLLRETYIRAARVIAVSSENLQMLYRRFGLPRGKGEVIYYGAAERYFEPRDELGRERLRESLGLKAHTMVSLTAARLAPVKCHILQVHALALLNQQAPSCEVTLVWAGEGELRSALEKEAEVKGVRSRIHFVGQQQDVAPWCDAADCFTLTSASEGMPIAIMEAMAKGLPIAATAVSGIPEEIADCGVLLPSPERDAAGVATTLARTWHQWASNPQVRLNVGARARTRASQVFRIGRMGQQTLAAISAALSTAKPAQARV